MDGHMNALIPNLAAEYKEDQESVYQIWFLNNEERLAELAKTNRPDHCPD